MVADNKKMIFGVHRALIFQGGGSLGAYEAGAYKDINEELSRYLRAEGKGDEPLFHIVSGTSIGAINAAILVSYVKENMLVRYVLASSSCDLLKEEQQQQYDRLLEYNVRNLAKSSNRCILLLIPMYK